MRCPPSLRAIAGFGCALRTNGSLLCFGVETDPGREYFSTPGVGSIMKCSQNTLSTLLNSFCWDLSAQNYPNVHQSFVKVAVNTRMACALRYAHNSFHSEL